MHIDNIEKFDTSFPFTISPNIMTRQPSRKTTVYKMVTGCDKMKFNTEVSWLLSDGWALYGSPVLVDSGHHIIYGQALTKEVEVIEQ